MVVIVCCDGYHTSMKHIEVDSGLHSFKHACVPGGADMQRVPEPQRAISGVARNHEEASESTLSMLYAFLNDTP
jgi:hypothetical protein